MDGYGGGKGDGGDSETIGGGELVMVSMLYVE